MLQQRLQSSTLLAGQQADGGRDEARWQLLVELQSPIQAIAALVKSVLDNASKSPGLSQRQLEDVNKTWAPLLSDLRAMLQFHEMLRRAHAMHWLHTIGTAESTAPELPHSSGDGKGDTG